MSHGIGELVLLAVITSIFILFLVTGRGYTPPSRLFPNLVCGFGLIFILWRFLAIIRSVSFQPLNWTRFGPLLKGSLGWQWSVLTMAGLILCMYTLGFVVGSVVYITGVILLSGDRKRGRALAIASLTAVSTYVLAKIVHLQLPTGFFTFIR
jgi:hypothetical protein